MWCGIAILLDDFTPTLVCTAYYGTCFAGNDGTNAERAVQPALEASAVVRHHMNGVPTQVSIHSTGLVKSIEHVELLLKENVA
jgi:hypothetical protein